MEVEHVAFLATSYADNLSVYQVFYITIVKEIWVYNFM
jgi:hypothetical protein